MTDLELLEMAAKALFGDMAGQMIDSGWNPLEDDGEALRLAVRRGIAFRFDFSYPEGLRVVEVGASSVDTLYGDVEFCGDDDEAAARRAITRIAAAIGKDMK